MILNSPYISGSLTVTGNATIQGSISGTITGSATSASYAQTASSIANLNQNVQITGSLTTNGTITAQTLVVQTVTSSIVYSSGSNIFGNSQSNVQQMTGSLRVTGSILVTGSAAFSGNVTAGGNAIVQSGNVLGVYRTDNTRAIQLYTTSDECVINSWEASSEPLHIRSMGSGGRIQFFTSGSEKMRITSAGVTAIAASSNTSDLGSTGLVIGGSSILTSGNVLMLNFIPIGHTSNRARAGIGCLVGADWGKGNLTFYTQDASSAAVMTTANERMRITSDGEVLMHSTTFSSLNAGQYFGTGGDTYFTTDTSQVLYINRKGNDGTLVDFRRDNSVKGTISVSGETVSYNSFLGSHWSQLQDGSKIEILKGTIIEAIDEMCIWEDETNDRLPKSKISDTVESKNVYGIFLAWDEDWETSNDFYVAAVGLGYIRINSSQDISMGDLLQSNGDGTAKIQEDDIMRSSTIAKAVSTQKIETYEDGSYLIAATLHCG